MTDYLTEDEQLHALKKWWQRNGLFTVIIVIIALVGYFGWQFWQNYQQQQAEAAATIYNDLLEAVTVAPGTSLTEEKRKTASYLIDQLKTNHSHSFYALSATLYGAKIAVEANEPDKAAELLQWALDHSDSSETDNLLRLRLARVMNVLMDYDQALEHSQYDAIDDFTPLFASVRGDAYLGKNDIPAAKAAYQLALDNTLPTQIQRQQLLKMKIIDLSTGGVEEPSAEHTEPSAEYTKPSAEHTEPSARSDNKPSAENEQPLINSRGVGE